MKTAVYATGLALLTLASPAYASWAENANKQNPVFTGTSASLAKARHGEYYGYQPRRFHHARKHYRQWR